MTTRSLIPFALGLAVFTAGAAGHAAEAVEPNLGALKPNATGYPVLGFEKVDGAYVATDAAPLYVEPAIKTQVVGEIHKGEKLEILGQQKGSAWVVVWRNGVGAGYVSIALLCPEKFCAAGR